MNKADYLIVGGGIAGTTAAEFIRMNDSSGKIAIITEEDSHLYSRVMLPHYLRDKIPFGRLYVRSLDQYKEKNIQLVTNKRVSSISTQDKTIYLSNGDEYSYNKLLISSGGKVNKLQIPGSDLKGVTYLRTTKDVKEVKDLMEKAKQGVVVGGGFIGIEYAQSFIHAGIETTCIVREPYFWSHMVGEQLGQFINKVLEEGGVKIIANAQVEAFDGKNQLQQTKLSGGGSLKADIAGIGIGIHMDLEHLKQSGVKLNRGVVTNEYLETETANVWAAGDIAEFKDIVFDKHHQMGNWSNAAAQGKIVGPNMVAGWNKPSEAREEFTTVSAYTISIFDKPFTFLGDPVVDDNTEVVIRGSMQEGKIGRIHLRKGVICGAALIGLNSDRRTIEYLIKAKTRINVKREKLSDTSFNLAKLVPNQ